MIWCVCSLYKGCNCPLSLSLLPQRIIVYLPELIHKKWQYNSICKYSSMRLMEPVLVLYEVYTPSFGVLVPDFYSPSPYIRYYTIRVLLRVCSAWNSSTNIRWVVLTGCSGDTWLASGRALIHTKYHSLALTVWSMILQWGPAIISRMTVCDKGLLLSPSRPGHSKALAPWQCSDGMYLCHQLYILMSAFRSVFDICIPFCVSLVT